MKYMQPLNAFLQGGRAASVLFPLKKWKDQKKIKKKNKQMLENDNESLPEQI